MSVGENEFDILIARLNNGDQTAFEEIYEKCSRYVVFVCSKFCSNKEDAEEIVQDTFAIAYKKMSTLRGETLLPYLKKIAANRCYHSRKKNAHHQKYVSYLDEFSYDPKELDINFLPEDCLRNKESQNELLQIIKGLPQTQREMIYLYYYLEMRMKEIADLHDCSINNVSKTIRTARNAIKSKLENADKKSVASMAGVSLSAVLALEESIFVANYASIATVGAVGVGAGVAYKTSAAVSVKTCAIAACAVAACAISAVVYFATLPETHESESIHIYENYTVAPETQAIDLVKEVPQEPEPEPPVGDAVPGVPDSEPEPQPTIPHVWASVPSVPDSEPEPGPDPQPTSPHIGGAVPGVPDSEPEPEPKPQPTVPPVGDAVLSVPGVEPEPDPEPDPQPEMIDRTYYILEALSRASTAEAVNEIIKNYGFALNFEVYASTYERYRFYLANEGSGDILIGISANTNEQLWHMRYRFFENAQMISDRIELFRWMEG